jgi:hypothetical protein
MAAGQAGAANSNTARSRKRNRQLLSLRIVLEIIVISKTRSVPFCLVNIWQYTAPRIPLCKQLLARTSRRVELAR